MRLWLWARSGWPLPQHVCFVPDSMPGTPLAWSLTCLIVFLMGPTILCDAGLHTSGSTLCRVGMSRNHLVQQCPCASVANQRIAFRGLGCLVSYTCLCSFLYHYQRVYVPMSSLKGDGYNVLCHGLHVAGCWLSWPAPFLVVVCPPIGPQLSPFCSL